MKSRIRCLGLTLAAFGMRFIAAQNGLQARVSSGYSLQQPVVAPAKEKPVTFNHDVAPIVFANCAVCHRTGGPGPFPLLHYAQVKNHAKQVAIVTQLREMPPWLPDPGPFKFVNERRLTPEQIATIKKWIDGGELEGNSADLPPQPSFKQGWQLGKPDLVLYPDHPFQLAAGGTDQYWNFVLEVPIKRTRWLKGIEVLPENPRVVHHAFILVDRAGAARQLEQASVDGFPGMNLRIGSERNDSNSHFLFWKPGIPPYVYPDAMSVRIDKGTDFVLSLHLQPSGKPELVQPKVGVYFAAKPPTQYPLSLLMENDAAIDIPPRSKRYLVSDDFTLPIDADLLAVYPHAHYLAEDLGAFVTFPDGTKIDLIHIRHWDLYGQAIYRYQKAIFLPKGSTISMRYVYNNSEGNVSNPNYPPKRVVAGSGIGDEMAHLWLQLLPRDANENDAQRALEAAISKHQSEKEQGTIRAHQDQTR